MPLVRSWWLSKKKGKETFIVPEVRRGTVNYRISHDLDEAPTAETDGTVGRTGARCIACEAGVELQYIRAEGQAHRMSEQLMAVVAEGNRSRVYLAPDVEHENSANLTLTSDAPDGELFDWPGRINVVRYGMTKFSDLFTNRQLLAMTTLSDLVGEARDRILADALAASRRKGKRVADGGTDVEAYADAVATYLGLAVSRCADRFSSICSWDASMQKIRNVFARQAIPMAWDFAEGNPFSASTGNWSGQVEWVYKALARSSGGQGYAVSASALDYHVTEAAISTDPPGGLNRSVHRLVPQGKP